MLRPSHGALALLFSPLVHGGAANASTCDSAPTSLSDVAESVARLESAWVQMDVAGVQHASGTVLERAACASEPLPPDLVARIHRAVGLVRVTRGDQEGAAQSFASARLTSPELALPTTIAPQGSVVAELYARPIPEFPPFQLKRVPRGSLLVDGQVREEASPGRPLVLQHLAPRGEVLGTWWVESTAELPEAPWVPPKGPSRGRLRAAGVAAVGTGLLAWTVAGASHAAHQNESVDRTPQALTRYRDVSRAGTIVGGVLLLGGTSAVGLSFVGTTP